MALPTSSSRPASLPVAPRCRPSRPAGRPGSGRRGPRSRGVGGAAPARVGRAASPEDRSRPRRRSAISAPVFSRCRREDARPASSCRLLGLEVEHLAAAHAERAGGAARGRRPASPRCAGIGRPVVGRASTSKASACSASPARIAVASSKAAMAGGPAAAQRRIVHRRQVVVDQRVAVDQLDRGADARARPPPSTPNSSAAGGDQERPQALAAAEHGIAHRLVQPRLRPVPPRGSSRSSSASTAAATAAHRLRAARSRSLLLERLQLRRCPRGRGSASRPAAAPGAASRRSAARSAVPRS